MHTYGEHQVLAVSTTTVTFLFLGQHSWKQLHTKKHLKSPDHGVKPQAEIVLRVQEAARLKLAELTAVSKVQVKVLKLLPWLSHEFYFKCFFKWVGGVLALTNLSDHKLADLLSAPVLPHRAVGGILYILPISVALPSAASWIAFVYCLTIAT